MGRGVLALSLTALIGGTYQTGYRAAAMKKDAEIAVIRAEQVAGLLAAEQAHNAKLEQAAAEWRQRQESAERQARSLAAAKTAGYSRRFLCRRHRRLLLAMLRHPAARLFRPPEYGRAR